MVTRILSTIMTNLVALWAAERLIHGVTIDHLWPTLVIAGAVLGALNALVRPIVMLLALPLIILTLGIGVLIVNAAMLLLTAHLVHGIHFNGFGAVASATLLISLVNWLLGMAFGAGRG
jgi:putative membrane protein